MVKKKGRRGRKTLVFTGISAVGCKTNIIAYTRFYWIAGALSCHKSHKMAVLFISVLSSAFVERCFGGVWITSLRGGNATIAPPPRGRRRRRANHDGGGGRGGDDDGCCFYFRSSRKFSLLFILLYLYKFVYYFPRNILLMLPRYYS